MLRITGIDAAPDLYGKLEGEAVPRMMAMIAKNDSLEKSITDKAGVTALLRRSLDAVRAAFTRAPDAELDRLELFFGERSTVRRVYMRALTHMHEHMDQTAIPSRRPSLLSDRLGWTLWEPVTLNGLAQWSMTTSWWCMATGVVCMVEMS